MYTKQKYGSIYTKEHKKYYEQSVNRKYVYSCFL